MATIDVMISEEEIAKKVEELAKQIEKDYEGEQLLVVGILKGASVFVSDLIRKINLDVNIDFMSVSSYGNGTESSGTVRILKDLDVDIAGKNVLIVEDIIDYIKSSDNNKFLKITICDETKSIFNSVLRKLGTVSDIDILDVSHMSRKTIRQGTEDVDIEYFYTEISIKGADKWTAIEYLINFLNIEKEEVIAIR